MEIPVTDIARSTVGEQYANMIMLGAFVNRTHQVKFSSMIDNMDIILGKGKAKFKDKNIEALKIGYEYLLKEK